MRFLSTLVLLGLFAFVLPAQSGAAGTNAPPGASAIDQYLETVPDVDGNGSGSTGSPPPDLADPVVRRALKGVLPAAAVKELAKSGRDGSAVAALAAVDARRSSHPPGSAAGDAAARSERSSLSALAGTLTGGTSGGIGLWLPLLLAGVTCVFVLAAVGRRRADRR